VTFNRASAFDFYRERVYKLEETDYDVSDRTAAWEKALEWGDRIPIGVVYRVEGQPTYEEQVPALREGPLASRPLARLSSEQVTALRTEVM
jgi:2-oxoglutarate ferredoxin oxidoreductase subunit beta